MAQLSLLVVSREAPIVKMLSGLGVMKGKLPLPVEVVIDPETADEQHYMLQPQREAHLIQVTSGHHVVAVLDPDREKHVNGATTVNGIAANLSGLAVGAAIGWGQGVTDLAQKGFSKMFVGDPTKRWEKAFQRFSVKEVDIGEGETAYFRCEPSDVMAGIFSLTKTRG